MYKQTIAVIQITKT